MAKTDFEDFSDDFDEIVEADDPEEEPEEEETPKAKAEAALKEIKRPAPSITPKKTVPTRKTAPPVEEPEEEELPAPIVQAQAAKKKEKPVPAARYVAYKTEKRYGLIDNITGQPIAESADVEALTLTILSDILNKLDRIESSL